MGHADRRESSCFSGGGGVLTCRCDRADGGHGSGPCGRGEQGGGKGSAADVPALPRRATAGGSHEQFGRAGEGVRQSLLRGHSPGVGVGGHDIGRDHRHRYAEQRARGGDLHRRGIEEARPRSDTGEVCGDHARAHGPFRRRAISHRQAQGAAGDERDRLGFPRHATAERKSEPRADPEARHVGQRRRQAHARRYHDRNLRDAAAHAGHDLADHPGARRRGSARRSKTATSSRSAIPRSKSTRRRRTRRARSR